MTDLQINIYRHLLQKYFDAETTPEQESQLMEMASRFDLDSLPEDLSSDTQMLRDMMNLHSDVSDFASSLDRICKEEPSQKRYAGKIGWILSLSGVAAAVLLVIFFVGKKDGNLSTSDPTPRPILIAKTTPPTIVNEEQPLPSHVSETIPDLKVKEKDVEKSEKKEELSHGFVEVTDPEEASIILEQSLNLLAENLGKSNSGLRQSAEILNNTFEKTEKTLNNILL